MVAVILAQAQLQTSICVEDALSLELSYNIERQLISVRIDNFLLFYGPTSAEVDMLLIAD